MDQHDRRQVRNFVSGHLLPSYLDARIVIAITGLEQDVVQCYGDVSGNGRAEYVKPVEQMHQRAQDQLPELQRQHAKPYHLLGIRNKNRHQRKPKQSPFRGRQQRNKARPPKPGGDGSLGESKRIQNRKRQSTLNRQGMEVWLDDAVKRRGFYSQNILRFRFLLLYLIIVLPSVEHFDFFQVSPTTILSPLFF